MCEKRMNFTKKEIEFLTKILCDSQVDYMNNINCLDFDNSVHTKHLMEACRSQFYMCDSILFKLNIMKGDK